MRVLGESPLRQQAQALDLLRKLEPGIRVAFLTAIRDSQRSIDFVALVNALERGDIEAAIRAANVSRADLSRFAEAMRSAFVQVGTSLEIRARGGVRVPFDAGEPLTEATVTASVQRSISGITDEGADAIRRMITVRLNEGRSPQSIVTDIVGRRVGRQRTGGILGLTDGMVETIIRAETDLRSGDEARLRRYLGLKLRDRRFDRAIRQAIETGKPIPAAKVRQIIEAHEAKALGYRGKVIAATETARMAAAARHEGWRQAIASGAVRNVTVEWRHNGSAEPRLDHVAMSGTALPFGSLFLFPGGTPMRFPHDPTGPARHVIGCRCQAVYSVGR